MFKVFLPHVALGKSGGAEGIRLGGLRTEYSSSDWGRSHSRSPQHPINHWNNRLPEKAKHSGCSHIASLGAMSTEAGVLRYWYLDNGIWWWILNPCRWLWGRKGLYTEISDYRIYPSSLLLLQAQGAYQVAPWTSEGDLRGLLPLWTVCFSPWLCRCLQALFREEED